MPGIATVKRCEHTLSDAGSVEGVAQMSIAFGLFVEVGASPGIAVVAAHHDALTENGGEDLSVVAVDAEHIGVQTVAARFPRGPVVNGTVDASSVGGNEHGVFVIGHVIRITHVAGKSV